jgi:hypothetical protein
MHLVLPMTKVLVLADPSLEPTWSGTADHQGRKESFAGRHPSVMVE